VKFLLDTDTCIFLLNGTRPVLAKRALATPPADVGLSAIGASELAFGAAKSQRSADARARLDTLLGAYAVLPYDALAIDTYAAVRADLERRGTPIGPMDTLIAAHALSLDLTLVTGNVREFKRVRGLRVADWTR
jgi:tRNA(fMet)-specific endonuclease VapC